jgi:hypothetical protein
MHASKLVKRLGQRFESARRLCILLRFAGKIYKAKPRAERSSNPTYCNRTATRLATKRRERCLDTPSRTPPSDESTPSFVSTSLHIACLLSKCILHSGWLLVRYAQVTTKIVHLRDVPKCTSLVRCLLVLSGQRFETTFRRRRCGTTTSRGREEPVVQPVAVYTRGGQFSL